MGLGMKEIGSHRGEAIDEHPGFEAFAAVLHIGFHVKTVPGGHDFGFSPNGEREFTADHKRGL
jgi:hypothetical protein